MPEIARHGGREGYRAAAAGRQARRARSRLKARRLDADPVLGAGLAGLLTAGCSPGQAAGRLRYLAGRCDPEGMPETVSAEAICTWICACPKGN